MIQEFEIRKNRLTEILRRIPWEVWEEVVKKEPEWRQMESFRERYRFRPFAVLMIASGLNDYQLKGPAEKDYWPKIREFLENFQHIPKTPIELYKMLIPFYRNERLNNTKIARLEKS